MAAPDLTPPKAPKAKRHYVNNKDLYAAMVLYREKLKEKPDTRVPEYIGVCIDKICHNMSLRYNFINYSYRDEMIGDAVENCIKAVPNFDPDRTTNPFAYFSMVAWNAFVRRIKVERKEQYIKHKNMQHITLLGEFDDGGTDQIYAMHIKAHEQSDAIIDNFEKKLPASKKRGKIGIEKFAKGPDDAESR